MALLQAMPLIHHGTLPNRKCPSFRITRIEARFIVEAPKTGTASPAVATGSGLCWRAKTVVVSTLPPPEVLIFFFFLTGTLEES